MSATRLQAELHAMLVYGKGQFFLPHQDSEKDDAMASTLVVSLPSAHTGGELVVEHGGQSVTFRAPKEDLSRYRLIGPSGGHPYPITEMRCTRR